MYDELRRFNQRFRPTLDETEAYLRHRERVREREKRDKLKKEGKLDEYLQEKNMNVPKPVEQPEPDPIEVTLQKYKETKKLGEENFRLVNYSKFDVDEKKVEKIVNRMRRTKKLKKKWAQLEQEEQEAEIEEPPEFNPRMAGKTGLPIFFFDNVVHQNRSAFQRADYRSNRLLLKTFGKKF